MTSYDEIIIYLAGIVDGEGCITTKFDKRSPNYLGIRFSIEMTNRTPLDLFSSIFGGNICKYQRSIDRKLSYKYDISGNKALAVLKQITPYLRVKKQQAELALKIFHLKSLNESFENQNQISCQIRELNK